MDRTDIPLAESQGSTRWGEVWIAVLAGVVVAAHVGKVPPALPGLRGELDLGLVAAGWVVSLFSVTGMALGIFAGALGDRLGARRQLVWGLACLAGGSMLGAVAESGATLLVSRGIEGIGFLAAVVAAPSLIVAASQPGDRRLAFGLWGTYMPAGSAVMIIAAPALIDAVGWRGLWLFIGGLSAAWAAVVLMRIPAPPRGGQDGVGGLLANVRRTLGRRGVVLLSLCFTGYTVQWISLMAWLPTALIETRGVSSYGAAAVTALVVVANVPGNLAAGWLLHRGLARWMVIAGAAVAMALAAVGLFSDAVPDVVRFILCLCFSAFGGMIPATVLGGAPAFAPSAAQAGAANGMVVQGSHLGQVVGPPLVGAVVAAGGGSWQAGLWVMLAAAAAVVALAFMLRDDERALDQEARAS